MDRKIIRIDGIFDKWKPLLGIEVSILNESLADTSI